jgi:hypothetical protein
MSGVELQDALLRAGKPVPLVFLTGRRDKRVFEDTALEVALEGVDHQQLLQRLAGEGGVLPGVLQLRARARDQPSQRDHRHP